MMLQKNGRPQMNAGYFSAFCCCYARFYSYFSRGGDMQNILKEK